MTAVSNAQMLLDDRRPEEALAALALLPVKHTAALRLEQGEPKLHRKRGKTTK